MGARTLGVALAALGAACGGGEQQRQQPPAQTPSTPAISPVVVDVRMTGSGRVAAFEPAALTIAPGTTVRFINVSGGPHNIVFWKDSIPLGSEEVLNPAIVGRQGNLASPYAVQPNATIEITFPATLPLGVYKGFCAPHLMMGMKLVIRIQ